MEHLGLAGPGVLRGSRVLVALASRELIVAVRACGLWPWCDESARPHGRAPWGLPAQHGSVTADLPAPSHPQGAQYPEVIFPSRIWLVGPSINDSLHFWASVGGWAESSWGGAWVG